MPTKTTKTDPKLVPVHVNFKITIAGKDYHRGEYCYIPESRLEFFGKSVQKVDKHPLPPAEPTPEPEPPKS